MYADFKDTDSFIEGVVEYIFREENLLNYAKRNNLEISHASLVCEEYCYYLTVVYRKKAECVQVDRSGTIHAKWNISGDGYYPYCSNCNNEPPSKELTEFCHHCGARMDKE